MASSTLPAGACNCPRCSGHGRNVAAMNYKETQYWDKYGTFSGAGVGIGTGGIGVGVGGGSYSEHGEAQSKRARVFEEPQPFKPQYALIIVPFIFIAFGLNNFPMVANMLNGSDDSAAQTSFQVKMQATLDTLLHVVEYVAPVMLLFLAVSVFRRVNAEHERTYRLNETVYPRLLERYNNLYYCTACSVIYDRDGNSQTASRPGFDRMLMMAD